MTCWVAIVHHTLSCQDYTDAVWPQANDVHISWFLPLTCPVPTLCWGLSPMPLHECLTGDRVSFLFVSLSDFVITKRTGILKICIESISWFCLKGWLKSIVHWKLAISYDLYLVLLKIVMIVLWWWQRIYQRIQIRSSRSIDIAVHTILQNEHICYVLWVSVFLRISYGLWGMSVIRLSFFLFDSFKMI